MTQQRLSKEHSDRLFERVCSIGQQVETAKGTVWLKAVSKEVNGQYPASVEVVAPDFLKMAVNNFLGGTEALISAHADQFDIVTGVGEKMQRRRKTGTWGGIPLRWASGLFLGKIPCPVALEGQTLVFERPSAVELLVRVQTADNETLESYRYEFKLEEGEPWPAKLVWETLPVSKKVSLPDVALKEGAELSAQDAEVVAQEETRKVPEKSLEEKEVVQVDFSFDRPEEKSTSPQKWEARSDRGSVKVIWKERVITEISKI